MAATREVGGGEGRAGGDAGRRRILKVRADPGLPNLGGQNSFSCQISAQDPEAPLDAPLSGPGTPHDVRTRSRLGIRFPPALSARARAIRVPRRLLGARACRLARVIGVHICLYSARRRPLPARHRPARQHTATAPTTTATTTARFPGRRVQRPFLILRALTIHGTLPLTSDTRGCGSLRSSFEMSITLKLLPPFGGPADVRHLPSYLPQTT